MFSPFHLLFGRDPTPLALSTDHATLWALAWQIKYGGGMPTLAQALQEYPGQRFGPDVGASRSCRFLVWSLPEKAPVLVYSQAQHFSEAHWQRQITVLKNSPGWRVILYRYEVNLIAIDCRIHPEFAQALRRTGTGRSLSTKALRQHQEGKPQPPKQND